VLGFFDPKDFLPTPNYKLLRLLAVAGLCLPLIGLPPAGG
jgi:hypothetical protein